MDELRRVLLPPLRFAQRDNYACMNRLGGFQHLILKTLQRLEDDLPKPLATQLRQLGCNFDTLSHQARRARVESLLTALQPRAALLPKTSVDSKHPERSLRDFAPAAPVDSKHPERSLRDFVPAAPVDSKHPERSLRDFAPAVPVDSKHPERPQGVVKQTHAVGKGAQPPPFLAEQSPATVQALQADGIRTARDVLHVVPKDYVVCRAVDHVDDLRTGTVCAVFGSVVSVQRARSKVPRVDVTLHVISAEDTAIGVLRLTFFRLPQSANWFQPQRRLTLVGTVSRYRSQWQMVHPRILSGDRRQQASGVRVVYPTCAGLSSQAWEKVMAAARSEILQDPPVDPVAEEIRRTYQLAPLADAYKAVHEPPSVDDVQQWQCWSRKETPFHRRLAFEELLGLQIALSVKHNDDAGDERCSSPPLRGFAQSGSGGLETSREAAGSGGLRPFVSSSSGKLETPREVVGCGKTNPRSGPRELYGEFFPHEPTACQLRVLDEIVSDMAKTMPMTRLLHGDVGAGKTAVAAAVCLHVVRAGLQCALMAPTEVLARQHERTLAGLFAPLGIHTALVTNQLKGKQRKAFCGRLAAGEVHVAVGTHALLSDDIQFKGLGLCIIDEQHRFGVAQRARLRHKGERSGLTPHLLVMTATPIPRSLALVLYGNMSISTLRSLPAGRQPIATRLLRGEPEVVVRELTALLRRSHRKAYVVYPLIDESEKVDLADAKRGYAALQARLGEDKVLLLHSRLTSAQRQQVMEDFAHGDARVLVATTVVEVGVDVPSATCMVIVQAERFGLSQLHQLRGRVGRGKAASECLLVAPKHVSDTAYERLKVLTQTGDGFRIAEADLAARGPGDFVGKRQSGAPLLRCCDLLRHADLIEPARRSAAHILQRDPHLQDPVHESYRQTAAWQTLS